MSSDEHTQRIPLIAEEAYLTKSDVVTDHLRVVTTIDERQVLIEDVVERGDLHVERVPVDRSVTTAPDPRQEGDTLIVSIVEERLVVEKRLFVIEELRITRTVKTQRVSIPETVRTMRATVEHAPNPSPTGSDSNG
jgi:uncharacterized protein (TIGR02271 family)